MIHVIHYQHAVFARIGIELSRCTLDPEQSKTRTDGARRDSRLELPHVGAGAEVISETECHALAAAMGVQKHDAMARIARGDC
ncbi:hypothetical protein GCM10007863_21350 [Dyella mobilis]|nr:hypothetical protein GCM10007863_21350 [Dyella mobilis]